MYSLFDLKGRTALITGASSGIGKAIAQAMGGHGATVIVSSNDAEGCHSVCQEFDALGIDAVSIPCDVSSKEQLKSLVDQTIARTGRIDILVCNAGVSPHIGPIASADDRIWDQIMTVNLRSALWLSNLVIPYMTEQKDGSIIFMSSISSLRGNKSIGLYGISKAAIAQLARNLAVEWGPLNIRVNAISPGLIETPFAEELISNKEFMGSREGLQMNYSYR